ncbi:ARHGAP22_24_25 [Acanthosepion pharaonis]|uniref:ARHGAP22_24_25 n=1 Tax=Acanthosepion pharaonis TaxID=158019 RepID=A0A812C569_ACAPH|nr:ARHGAP22_24_25 [Sepia pharaonis]
MDVSYIPIIKKGWLKKQRARVKAWQRRWVVLNGACLFYFNREGDLKSLGSIVLPGNRVVAHSFSPDNPDKYLFEILPEKTKNGVPSHETILFCCDTDADRQDWIRAIRRVMYKSLGGAIFGQSLKETMEFEHKSGKKIPYIVQECVEFIENKGLEYEGLYRLPGRLVLIKELQESFDTVSREPIEVPEGNLLDLPLSECEVTPMQPVYSSAEVFADLSDDHNNKDQLLLVEDGANSHPAPSTDQQNNSNKTQMMPLLRRTREYSQSQKHTSSKRKSESELEKILQKQSESCENSVDGNTKRYGLSFLNSVEKTEKLQERKSLPLSATEKDYEKATYQFSPASISSLEDDIDNLRDELIHVKVAAHMEKNALQSELDKYKKLYEDSVKEMEFLKKQLDRERSAQAAAIEKVVNLQMILNDYQTKYGQIDS